MAAKTESDTQTDAAEAPVLANFRDAFTATADEAATATTMRKLLPVP